MGSVAASKSLYMGCLWRFSLSITLIGLQWKKVNCSSAYGLDNAVNLAQTDPLGDTDVFQNLTPALKNALLHPQGLETSRKIQALLSLQSTTLVNVKLVGFPNEDSRSQRSMLEAQFTRYMDALNQDIRVGMIAGSSEGDHELAIKTKVTVEVSRAGKALSEKIFAAIKQHLDTTGQANSEFSHYRPIWQSLQPVPHSIVDEIIVADLEKPLTSYTVYVLNLKEQDRKYGYDYSAKSTNSYFPKCLGSFWTGKDRYMWIDLAAGPVEYGPLSAGEGLVKGEMFPISSSYSGTQQQNIFMADLAALVWSAAKMLFVPAVRIPTNYEEVTEVHIVHIQGSNTTATEDMVGLDLKNIEAAFNSKENEGLFLPKQTLTFKYFSLKLAQCPLCAAAISRSYKSNSAVIFISRYSLFVDEYLDSKQLHESFSEFGHEMDEILGTDAPLTARVIPIYVLDIDSDRQIMLDRYHQVIPFRDMVIAVRSKTAQVVTEYGCNGRPMLIQTRLLERPIVGALLQTLWGVAPTHLTWSAAHNSTLVDYRWGLGQTPFGPFSDLTSLSFAQKDAAPRNVLYSMLNASVTTALELLISVKTHGGEKKLFTPKAHIEFTQRWNLFMYKLNKAVSSISHFDYKTALYFLKASEHDLYAFHSLVYTASGELEATLVCFKDPPFPWIWLVSILIALAAFAYLWFRRDKLFTNKKKRF